MIWVLAAVAIAVGVYAIYMWSTGKDPAYAISSAIAESLSTISASIADAISEFVSTILLPIKVPGKYLAYGLSRMSAYLGPLAVLGFVTLYFYMVLALALGRKADGRYVIFLLAFIAVGSVLWAVYKIVVEGVVL